MNRMFFGSRCLVLVLAGVLTTAPGYAGTTLRWKSPQADNATHADKNPIQQIRYDRQGSLEAELDTRFPESRRQYSSPAVSTSPLTLPSKPNLIEGNLLGNKEVDDFYGNDSDVGLTTPPPGTKVEIRCPDDNILKPITGISHDIRLKPGDAVPKECRLSGEEFFPDRDFSQICFMWKASALCHKPLYFEEEALERYGHTLVREEFQPIISGAKFFLTVPLLPYKMGLNPPCECVYTLGHYRPGNCAPYMMDPLPLSVRAGLLQAGAVVGGVAIFP